MSSTLCLIKNTLIGCVPPQPPIYSVNHWRPLDPSCILCICLFGVCEGKCQHRRNSCIGASSACKGKYRHRRILCIGISAVREGKSWHHRILCTCPSAYVRTTGAARTAMRGEGAKGRVSATFLASLIG